jgi:uncharacterized protein YbjT (DUF2867 family)
VSQQQQQTIAITGATGFIGRNLVKHLHDAGYHLKILVRDPNAASVPNDTGIEIIKGSLEDLRACSSWLKTVMPLCTAPGRSEG